MKRRVHVLALVSVLLGMALAGCAGMEFLEEVPKNIALKKVWESYGEELPQETSGDEAKILAESARRDLASSEPATLEPVSFLMQEACSYARDTLSPTEQLWYSDIEQILGSFGKGIELDRHALKTGLGEEDIDKIFRCVMYDHPELFYVDGYSYTKYTRGERISFINFSGIYSVDLETAMGRMQEIEDAAEDILAGIGTDASDYDKVKYVYDAVIRSTEYDEEVADNQNIYSVFVHHFSVCQGYAKATQYLLNRLGIECSLVQGMVETGEGHAWNLVKVDGNYYYVDTTWGDVSYRVDDRAYQEDMPDINYDYLNVTTQEISRTHIFSDDIPMPECTSVEANYYNREGALFVAYDREQMADLFQKAAEEGRRDVTVKCIDEACYHEVWDALIEDQEIFDYLKDKGNSVAYAQNEKQFSLTFWVTNE